MASITRADAADLFTEELQREVIAETTRRSVAMQTFRTLPMGSGVKSMPVLDALPTAGFLSAPQAVKPKTTIKWDKKTLTAEEVAVIVPVDDTVLADSSIDIVAVLRDLIAQEFGRVIDLAVFFGTGAPASYPTGGLHTAAVTASKDLAYDSSDPIGSWSDLFSLVEDPGADVDALWGARSLRGLLRKTRDNGNPSPDVNLQGVYGIAPQFPLGWDKDKSLAIVGDSSSAILGLRQDVTFTFSNQATITDFGNLFEKDSTAIRAVMRLGFCIADPIRLETGARDVPFATMTPEAVAS